MSLTLHLPFPPSVNAATRAGVSKTGKAFVYSSDKKRSFFLDADKLLMAQKRSLSPAIKGEFTYHLVLNEKLRHGNADGDNRGKYALDFLERAGLIENDKLARGGSWAWGPCEHGAMISVYPVNRVSETQETAEG